LAEAYRTASRAEFDGHMRELLFRCSATHDYVLAHENTQEWAWARSYLPSNCLVNGTSNDTEGFFGSNTGGEANYLLATFSGLCARPLAHESYACSAPLCCEDQGRGGPAGRVIAAVRVRTARSAARVGGLAFSRRAGALRAAVPPAQRAALCRPQSNRRRRRGFFFCVLRHWALTVRHPWRRRRRGGWGVRQMPTMRACVGCFVGGAFSLKGGVQK
jgi:hypothetical protein